VLADSGFAREAILAWCEDKVLSSLPWFMLYPEWPEQPYLKIVTIERERRTGLIFALSRSEIDPARSLSLHPVGAPA
jgi:hypothetical protein